MSSRLQGQVAAYLMLKQPSLAFLYFLHDLIMLLPLVSAAPTYTNETPLLFLPQSMTNPTGHSVYNCFLSSPKSEMSTNTASWVCSFLWPWLCSLTSSQVGLVHNSLSRPGWSQTQAQHLAMENDRFWRITVPDDCTNLPRKISQGIYI